MFETRWRMGRGSSLHTMDRFWQWAWDRYGSRYVWVITISALLLRCPSTHLGVDCARGGRDPAATVRRCRRRTGRAGHVAREQPFLSAPLSSRRTMGGGREVDRSKALEETYAWTRANAVKAMVVVPASVLVSITVVAAIAGAGTSRLVQYGVLGVAAGISTARSVYKMAEGALRPVRAALAGFGHRRFSATAPPNVCRVVWSSLVGSIFTFSATAAMVGWRSRPRQARPGNRRCDRVLTLTVGVPITIVAILSPLSAHS